MVLIAGGVAFKIHKGILSLKSAIFNDLFSMAHLTPDDQFDGCPIVHLTDSAEDIEEVLKVLYFSTRYVPLDWTSFIGATT